MDPEHLSALLREPESAERVLEIAVRRVPKNILDRVPD
jgi:hypothetical protein